MRALATLSLAITLALPPVAGAADAPTRRLAVIAGASRGGPERTPLRYATSDARDVSRVLRRLGGVALDDLLLVEEPDASALRAAFAGVATKADAARRSGQRVELFVYYSGHSDEQALLLGDTRLTYGDLRRELDAVPADVRVAILDSCASGAITRAKGGVHRPPFLLDAASRVSGHAFLTSSAADEAAQESDRIRASFFTHALLTGLRGAADSTGDGVVTLQEAYQFAFRETLAHTETTQAGAQHATYDIGLIGSGDVVMTDLRRADAVLVVPESLGGRLFVRNAAGQLVAELRKAPGSRIELALEEGRYDVRVAQGRPLLAGTVTLGAGARVVLDAARLSAVPVDATTSRGAPAPGDDPAPAPGDDHAGDSPDAPANGHALSPTFALAVRGGGAVSKARPREPTGFEGEVALGARFGDHLALELASGYQRIAGRTLGRMPVLKVGFLAEYTFAEVREVLVAIPVRATLQLALPMGRLRPYLLGGAGLSWVSIDRYALRDPGAAPVIPAHLWERKRFTTYHAGAGLEVRLARRAAASLELRHGWTSSERVLQEEDLTLRAISATAGLAWSF